MQRAYQANADDDADLRISANAQGVTRAVVVHDGIRIHDTRQSDREEFAFIYFPVLVLSPYH